MTPLTAQDIAAFLEAHPGFFQEHPSLLENINLPMHGGEHTPSLVERQLVQLRASNSALKSQLEELIGNARNNDSLLRKTQQVLLKLAAADSLQSLEATLQESLRTTFNVSTVILSFEPLANAQQAQSQLIDELLPATGIFCGALRPSQASSLFANESVASAAILRLPAQATAGKAVDIGWLAMGSADIHQFEGQQGTMFLEFIAAATGAVWSRLRNQPEQTLDLLQASQ